MNDLIKKTAIQAAQLEQLLAANGRTLVASTLLASILAYMQRDVIAPHIIIGWLAVVVMVNIIRIIVTFSHQRNPATDTAAVQKRLTQFRFGVIASSLLWGATSVLMFPDDHLQHQMFVIYVLTGLSAGGIVSYSVDLVSAIAYTLITLTPILIRLFLAGDSISITMSISGFLYLIFLIVSIRNINGNLIENITLRFDAVEREKEINQLAFNDPLTNLPNRRLLLDRLNHALVMSARTNKRGALLFLDLDHFKMLNDTLGHDMGDLLLKQVAERLLVCVRDSDTVSRLGGDEFVVMLEDLSEDHAEAAAQVEKIGTQITASLNRPYQLDAYEYHSTPSIGIAMFGDHGKSHEELLKHADIAMYQAKKAGRNAVRLFDFKMQETLNERTSVE
ncbi:MAG: diguanylate cyclase [Methylotenera sp.]|nr:diguanylate cyclase [Methylotenera sp.]